jgi:two-component system, chemotaxis family, sensor kinase Cph1
VSTPLVPQGGAAVTLDNCAQEPIHLLGMVQPHGAMLVLDGALQLSAWSANAESLLSMVLSLGLPLAQMVLAPAVREMVDACAAEPDDEDSAHTTVQTTIGNIDFDCITHRYLGHVLIEYERRIVSLEVEGMSAVKVHVAVDSLRRQKSISDLMTRVTQQVRTLTGFDRVMAYRFRHDDSGEVVAEARVAHLPPLLGMRYPASDIPAQARRLYLINTLRLIANVNDTPVAMLGRQGDAPIDMSHSVLRSVSPIHIEYLCNMGVGASMSVSIVVNGRLWGMLACHHMGPKQVPYSVRMAVDLLVQVLAATVQWLDTQRRSKLIDQSMEVRTRLMRSMVDDEDVLRSIMDDAAALCATLAAEAMIVCQHGRVLVHGDVDQTVAAAVIASLSDCAEELVVRQARQEWPDSIGDQSGKWVGMLAFSFDPSTGGWLVLLRTEQIEAVRWAGPPEKIITTGPLGPRLTPRGSFDEWRQTVIGMSKPWDHTQLVIARQLLVEMHRASLARHAETERARQQLFAMLGHDLRDPLHTINMAAMMLELGGDVKNLGQRIRSSSTRMARMVGQILDISRIEGGIGLGMKRINIDLRTVLLDIVDEARIGNPETRYLLTSIDHAIVDGDADRLSQVVGNLLSNAKNHGDAAHAIDIRLGIEGGFAVLSIRNASRPINGELARVLYDPFKRVALDNARNRGGMGLGLHLAHKIVTEHSGTIKYSYEAPNVIFAVEIPLALTMAPADTPTTTSTNNGETA